MARLCLAILIIALFVGGSQPIAVDLFAPPWDKIVHSLVYGGMLILARIAFPKTYLFMLFLLVVGIGVLDEVHQLYVAGRHPGLDDLLADTIGAFVAYVILKVTSAITLNDGEANNG